MRLHDIEFYASPLHVAHDVQDICEEGCAVAIIGKYDVISELFSTINAEYLFDIDELFFSSELSEVFVMYIKDDVLSILPYKNCIFEKDDVCFLEAGVEMSYLNELSETCPDLIVFSWDNDDWTDDFDLYEDDDWECDYCSSSLCENGKPYNVVVNVYGDLIIN